MDILLKNATELTSLNREDLLISKPFELNQFYQSKLSTRRVMQGWVKAMPKIKTNRAAAKRFKLTGGGKVKRKSAFRRHLLTSKTTKRKRHLRGQTYVAESDMRELNRLLPNG